MDYTTTILVDQTPQQAFTAINNVRAWWSENIEGPTDKLNQAFLYHYKDVHRCRIEVVELIPGQRVVWHMLENYFDFTKDHSELTGSKIIFDIANAGRQTEVRFTHQGLAPQCECYNICDEAWSHYINDSLYGLITTGEGQPTPFEAIDSFNNGLLEKHI